MEQEVLQELETIRQRGKGILYPEAVIEFASDGLTALHKKFEWDDKIAGHEYRLWQARHLIKLVITVVPSTDVEIQAYVSLSDDRQDSGGYRSTIDVLSDVELRKQMIDQAIRDFEYWQLKYNQLIELLPIFKTKDRVKAKLKKK